ncbi:hypothetical protein ACFY15_35385 [Streptomyces sp. NPDC001373]|uniref:hypothetical protein n=1 Tax=Streptomyces sp. NPDC001373 TaxID=3364565 RepID=UPI0036A9A38A
MPAQRINEFAGKALIINSTHLYGPALRIGDRPLALDPEQLGFHTGSEHAECVVCGAGAEMQTSIAPAGPRHPAPAARWGVLDLHGSKGYPGVERRHSVAGFMNGGAHHQLLLGAVSQTFETADPARRLWNARVSPVDAVTPFDFDAVAVRVFASGTGVPSMCVSTVCGSWSCRPSA